jgi:hypothetical protein
MLNKRFSKTINSLNLFISYHALCPVLFLLKYKTGSETHSDTKFGQRREGFSYIDASKSFGMPFRLASFRERT